MNMDLVLSPVRPFIWVEKIYGALPLSFKPPNVKVSICGLIYGVLLCTFCCTYGFFVYYFVYGPDVARSMAFYVTKAKLLLSCLFAAGCYSSYIFHICRIRRLFENILKHSHHLFNKYNRKKTFLFVTVELLLFWIINMIHILKFYIDDDPDNPGGDIDFDEDGVLSEYEHIITIVLRVITAFEQHYLVYSVTLINLQFCNAVLFLKSLVNVINIDLKKYLQWNKAFVRRSEAEEWCKKDNTFIDENGNIVKLVNFYDEICNLSKKLNIYFNPSLLITSILTLTTVLLCLYFFITKEIETVQFACNLSYSVLNLWLILFCCESLVAETKRTGILVHNLLAQTKDQRLKEQLQQFSLQLLHRKIKFTACGLFPLNYTLIYSIAGAVTTYLVILIQFQDASKGHGNPPNNTCPAVNQ